MHEYLTRHMVALREFNYADASLKPGDTFVATPIDAGYLTRAGKAREGEVVAVVEAEDEQFEPATDDASDEVVPVRRRGRPRKNP